MKHHGDALSQRLMNWCDVTDELDLPEVHRLLLVTPKSGEHGMLGAIFKGGQVLEGRTGG